MLMRWADEVIWRRLGVYGETVRLMGRNHVIILQGHLYYYLGVQWNDEVAEVESSEALPL
jgi:hypothetical protein